MTGAVEIRRRTAQDLAPLLTVLAACAGDSGYFADDEGQLVPHAAESINDPRFTRSWVAKIDAEIIGQISIMPLAQSEDPEYLPLWLAATAQPIEQHALIKRLFVHPKAQGRGAASLLMETAMAELAASGLIGVLDTASVARSAMALYRKLGWREVGRTKPSWTDEPFDAVLFVQPGH